MDLQTRSNRSKSIFLKSYMYVDVRANTIDSLDCVSPSSRRRVGGRSYKVVSIKLFFKGKPVAGADLGGFESENCDKNTVFEHFRVIFMDWNKEITHLTPAGLGAGGSGVWTVKQRNQISIIIIKWRVRKTMQAYSITLHTKSLRQCNAGFSTNGNCCR